MRKTSINDKFNVSDFLISFKKKNNKAISIAKKVIADPQLIPELMNGFLSDIADIKFKSAKVLKLVSKTEPKMLYPYFDFFVEQLDNQNNILKWNAIEIVANLVTVDVDNKIELILKKLFKMLYDGNMITAVHIVASAQTIIKARPYLEKKFTREILKSTNAPLPTEECRNILKGYQITVFEQYFNQIKEKNKVIEHVKKELHNSRNATRKKAEKFIKKFG